MEENIVIRNEKKEDWVNVNHWDFVKSPFIFQFDP